MALDQGTTSSRCILFDRSGTIRAVAQKEFTQYYPKPGWVEHDAQEIWDTTLEVARGAMLKNKISARDIAGIGITNQRETTIVWDKNTGEPVYNAIVWQCRRTSGMVDELVKAGLSDKIRAKTGLVPDAYFSGTKLRWILDNVPGVRERAEAGELLFGTVDTWLIWKLTGGLAHVTDYTNASRTMLFDIRNLCWDEELLELLNIPRCMLPEVRPSSQVYGWTQYELLGGEIPVAGAAGDQQSALFGQCCFDPGDMKNTYGTGCFLLMNSGEKPILSKNNLITTVAWKIGDVVNYALEGSIFVGGSVVQWLRDGLGVIKSSSEVEALASQVPDTNGVYFVPALTGLGAPWWDQYARGTITGISRGTTTAHIARAALEGIAYQTMDITNAMSRDAGVPLKELKVDGGASRNNLLMQFQADILGTKVIRPQVVETTAMGAAYLAGLAVGYWSSIDEIRKQWQVDRIFEPSWEEEKVRAAQDGWKDAVKRTLSDYTK